MDFSLPRGRSHCLSAVPAIQADDAAADRAGFLVDVRELDEWVLGHVAHATHIPMSEIVDRVSELPRDQRIIVMCRSGNRSGRVTEWLVTQGFDAVNLTGGAQAWINCGFALVDSQGNPGVVA